MSRNTRQSAQGKIILDEKQISISGITPLSTVSIESYLANGSRIYPASLLQSGNASQTALFAVSSKSHLSKVGANYTLYINATGYSGRQISVANTQSAVGTIKLLPLTVETGVWTNVTPAGFTLDFDFHGTSQNFGAMDVLADPVRPNDVYAFSCYQGVWKSTNAGVNWTKITATGVMDAGRAWGECIDLNPNRDPNTPPTMWACQGYGVSGIFKSTDGGVTWANYAIPFGGNANSDPYSPQVDPFDANHLITGIHEQSGVAESVDGGVTWHDASGDMNGGISWYPFFINTGSAATTRTTWIAIAQVQDGSAGTVRTTDGGTHWTKVSSNEHAHGGTQIYQAGAGGVVYISGDNAKEGKGISRSTDLGATWTHVGQDLSGGSVYGTPNHVYSSCNGATNAYQNPYFQVGDSNGQSFVWATSAVPAGMTNGPKVTAVTYDASIGKYVLVGGSWSAGIWRYIEP
ncbi:MAG: exo-alpha-sialidase [Fibrobacteres bacterium]|nr:exo-alpha-sialidase [Fibrobacterota bacterium]